MFMFVYHAYALLHMSYVDQLDIFGCKTILHMLYYLVYDYICWAQALMEKEYCRGVMYSIYYYVIFPNTYTEMIIVMKFAED